LEKGDGSGSGKEKSQLNKKAASESGSHKGEGFRRRGKGRTRYLSTKKNKREERETYPHGFPGKEVGGGTWNRTTLRSIQRWRFASDGGCPKDRDVFDDH